MCVNYTWFLIDKKYFNHTLYIVTISKVIHLEFIDGV